LNFNMRSETTNKPTSNVIGNPIIGANEPMNSGGKFLITVSPANPNAVRMAVAIDSAKVLRGL